jgi:hypothetical protein
MYTNECYLFTCTYDPVRDQACISLTSENGDTGEALARLGYLIPHTHCTTHLPSKYFGTHMVDMVQKHSSKTKYNIYRTGMLAHVVL